MGDDYFIVKGKIVSDKGKPIHDCTVALREKGKPGEPWGIGPRPVPSEFQTTFVAPFRRSAHYYVEIACDGYPDSFKTREFKISDAVVIDYDRIIDIGTIEMAR